MLRRNRLRCQSSLLAVVALVALGLPACVPTTWLPDSSGFVYINPVKGKNHGDRPTAQLVHFDINKKESRVVVADLGVDGGWPAVSPDGKQIAIARIEGQPQEARTVQIVIYDFDGKKVKESEALPWTAKPEDKKGPTASDKVPLVFWSPRNDMLVGWMADPLHRANLLSPNYTEIGVGVAKTANGKVYFCQDFGKQQ